MPHQHRLPGHLRAARPRQRDVAPLTGNTVRALVHAAVHDDAAAAAGAQDDPENQPYPAPAPSAASLSAKQLASFSTRTSRPSAWLMSWSKRWPFRPMELAFLTSPVAGLITPGMPIPTVALAAQSRLAGAHQTRDRLEHLIVRERRRNALAQGN